MNYLKNYKGVCKAPGTPGLLVILYTDLKYMFVTVTVVSGQFFLLSKFGCGILKVIFPKSHPIVHFSFLVPNFSNRIRSHYD